VQEIILNIDIAPTLIDLAGLSKEPQAITDGQSFKSLLTGDPVSKWRSEFLVEHQGEVQEVIDGCPDLSYQNVAVSLALCVNLSQQNVALSLASCPNLSRRNVALSLALFANLSQQNAAVSICFVSQS